MSVKRFVDTNILLYAYDLQQDSKRQTAIECLEEGWEQLGSLAVSVQVLQEFYVNFIKMGGTQSQARQVIEDLSHWPVVDNSRELLGHALVLSERWQVSLWDAGILAAAFASGASELLTEDLSHGQDYGGVVVVNPFLQGEG